MTMDGGRVARVEVDVPFHDVDLGGIVWHGHFLKYFEIARTALMRSFDLDIDRLHEIGVRVVVAESRCRHHRPLRYGERAVVSAWVETIQPAVSIRYRIDHAGALVAEGRTTLVAVAPDVDRLVNVPPAVLDRLRWAPPEDGA